MALIFPKSVRLTRSSEFLRVKTKGRTVSGRYMVLGVLKEADPKADLRADSTLSSGKTGEGVPGKPDAAASSTRVGVITSRRVGGAVVRNRVRRRLRELVRLSWPQRIPGVWLVVIARRAAADATFAELSQEWLRLARRSGVLAAREASVSESTAQTGTPIQPRED